jgi:hypothetical protein
MTLLTDTDPYRRGIETLPASWEEYARGATDGAVHRLPGVAAAVFTNQPERHVYKNTLELRHRPRRAAPRPSQHGTAKRRPRADDQPLDQRRGPLGRWPESLAK